MSKMYRQAYKPRTTVNYRSYGRGRREKVMDVSLIMRNIGQVSQPVVPIVVEPPKHQFSDFVINEQLKQNIISKGYMAPTPIQDQVIPLALQNRDVVGIANTGTGKTAAFLVPLINKVMNNCAERVLILAPTRELAVQIQEELRGFATGLNIWSVLCIGGVGIHQQIAGLRQNPSFVIGTPGRIKDLKNQGKLQIALFANIVLDEVDRMLDMGFIADMRYIISHLPKQRQSLFFSATMTNGVKSIIDTLSQQPVMISVKSQETAVNIEQNVVPSNGRQKIDVLHDLLKQEGFSKVIIFGRTKFGIEKLFQQLLVRGVNAVAMHGNKSQGQRQRALQQFKNNQVRILLATDVVARGIDIDDVTHVINYDLPESYDDYVHRIGRTGRSDKKGIALTLLN